LLANIYEEKVSYSVYLLRKCPHFGLNMYKIFIVQTHSTSFISFLELARKFDHPQSNKAKKIDTPAKVLPSKQLLFNDP